jgi:EAL domain-containing protein (putative c-di-GMP-specific phosphodiesterase class I)
VFDLRTGTVLGVEALARFDLDSGLDPGPWFSEAWALGLGLDLELSILCKAVAIASDRPPGLFLSVNVTPLTATSDKFATFIEQVEMPSALVFEITEQTRVEDYPMLNERLARVRSCGARLAVDDAGAGYASLRHIVQLRPDFIKLDMSFAADIEDNRAQQAMVSSLVHFGEETGSTIVAEGIEKPGQLESLMSLGITVGQGHLLAAPQVAGVSASNLYASLAVGL